MHFNCVPDVWSSIDYSGIADHSFDQRVIALNSGLYGAIQNITPDILVYYKINGRSNLIIKLDPVLCYLLYNLVIFVQRCISVVFSIYAQQNCWGFSFKYMLFLYRYYIYHNLQIKCEIFVQLFDVNAVYFNQFLQYIIGVTTSLSVNLPRKCFDKCQKPDIFVLNSMFFFNYFFVLILFISGLFQYLR